MMHGVYGRKDYGYCPICIISGGCWTTSSNHIALQASLVFIIALGNVKISKFNCVCISIHETHIWNLEKNKGAWQKKFTSLLDFNPKVKFEYCIITAYFDFWNILNNMYSWVVSWRCARPDVRMHPLRCRLGLHPPPPPVGMGRGESAAPEFTS